MAHYLSSNLIFALLLFMPFPGFAYDLGVYGESWEIAELDIRSIIAEQIHAIDWQNLEHKLVIQAQQLGKYLPSMHLPKTNVTQSRFINPAIVLTHDISSNGQIFYHHGTWVNPLHFVRPVTQLLFFNPESSEEQQFAATALKAYPYQLMLVATQGNPLEFSKKIHQPVYYALPALIKRFHIQATPSLLGAGYIHSTHADELVLTSFSRPYSLKEIERCWHGCK